MKIKTMKSNKKGITESDVETWIIEGGKLKHRKYVAIIFYIAGGVLWHEERPYTFNQPVLNGTAEKLIRDTVKDTPYFSHMGITSFNLTHSDYV